MRLADIVLDALRARGALAARLLSSEEIERARRIENEYSEKPTPWGRTVNQGLLECLKRRFVVAVLTSPNFKWPTGPYALIMVGGRIAGTIDGGGIKLDPRSLAGAKGEHSIVVLPLEIVELNEVLENPIAASPSSPTHVYLLQLMGASCSDCGTLLVGCDGVKRELAKA